MATETKTQEAPTPKAKRSFQFPSAVTTLVIVTLLVWIAALFIPSGAYKETPDGAPIPAKLRRQAEPADPCPGQRHLRTEEPRHRGGRHRDAGTPVRPDRRHLLH